MGDLEQSGALVFAERTVQRDAPIDDSELGLLRLAGSAILSVHSGMTKADRDTFKRPSLSSRVHPNRH